MGNLNSGLHWLQAFGNTTQLSGSQVGKWAEKNFGLVVCGGLCWRGELGAHHGTFKAVYFVVVELLVAEK